MLTEKIHLLEGISIGGQRYKTVVLRAPIVKDSLEIEKETDGKGVVYISLLLLSKSIIEVGNTDASGELSAIVPKEKITVEALGTLNEEDLERMQQARDYLKKKLHWQRAN
jgi:phage FluMu protein gp41